MRSLLADGISISLARKEECPEGHARSCGRLRRSQRAGAGEPGGHPLSSRSGDKSGERGELRGEPLSLPTREHTSDCYLLRDLRESALGRQGTCFAEVRVAHHGASTASPDTATACARVL